MAGMICHVGLGIDWIWNVKHNTSIDKLSAIKTNCNPEFQSGTYIGVKLYSDTQIHGTFWGPLVSVHFVCTFAKKALNSSSNDIAF